MAFGLSGNQRRAQMIGGDVTVAWMDHSTGKGKYIMEYLFVGSNIFSFTFQDMLKITI